MQWALSCLGLPTAASAPSPKDVQRSYRERLREVHPDHGAAVEGAAQRIAELTSRKLRSIYPDRMAHYCNSLKPWWAGAMSFKKAGMYPVRHP